AWNKTYYKDAETGEPLQQLPLNSVLLTPEPGTVISTDAVSIAVQGVAYPGGTGSSISQVEVSADRGKSWQTARCRFDQLPTDVSARHAWVLFEAHVELPPAAAAGCGLPLEELWVRARCANGEEQPEVSRAHGGYFYNGYHKVPLIRQPAADLASQAA
ncbi:unnamed protein product, partial [Polarella glacialis]